MRTNDKELTRILENPDNAILSSGLEDLLDDNLEDEETSINDEFFELPSEDDLICFLETQEREYTAKIVKMMRLPDNLSGYLFKFVLFVPTFAIEELFEERYLTLNINDYSFLLADKHKLSLKGDFLTITTRRKINETV